jgi:hypothetical protein
LIEAAHGAYFPFTQSMILKVWHMTAIAEPPSTPFSFSHYLWFGITDALGVYALVIICYRVIVPIQYITTVINEHS